MPKMTAPTFTPVIVIDAFDECGSPALRGQLAKHLLSLAESVPKLRLFVTSRPVPETVGCFASASDTGVSLNINDEEATDEDITLFMATKSHASELEATTEQTGRYSSGAAH